KHHKRHKVAGAAGVEGVVLDATCPGPCQSPPPPEPVYTGAVTVQVRNPGSGTVVASQAVSDGHFRIAVAPGSYDVASVPPAPPSSPPPCQPQPGYACPMVAGPEPSAIISPCETGETQHADVLANRFTPVTLHVRNSCVA